MEPQGLNNNCNYNNHYNIVFSPHLFNRKSKRDLNLYKVEETIMKGAIVPRSKYPKTCKKLYFGKENETYFAVFMKKGKGIKVVTAWKRKGN